MPLPLPQDDYKVSLDVFEGPLDLLLYLIRKDELDIYDIPIEHITRQYTEYLRTMEMLDLNIASEFIVMASTLALIKSRMLLPLERRGSGSDDGSGPEDEGVDPRWDLVRQLVEYKRFKDAASRLQEREYERQNVFGTGGRPVIADDGSDDGGRVLGDVGLFDLISAFNEVLANAPTPPIGEIEPIAWTVPDKIDMILRLAKRSESIAFSSLFHKASPRGEIIVTFIALLELLRLRQVAVYQSGTFAEIVVKLVPPGEGDTVAPLVGGGESPHD